MDTSNDTTPLKQCSRKDRCVHPLGSWQPATIEHFSRNAPGLRAMCRLCSAALQRERRLQNDEHRIAENKRFKEWREQHPDRVAAFNERNRQRRALRKDEINAKRRERRIADPAWRDSLNARNRQQYRDDEQLRGKRVQSARQYRAENPQKVSATNARWRSKVHRELLVKKRAYSQSEQGRQVLKKYVERPEYRQRRRVHDHNRRARLNSLPNTLTVQQSVFCFEWWHNCCCYCGAQRNFWNVIELDHFIPISAHDCPGTIASNMIPACRSCNASKNDKRPEQWLAKQLGKRKARVVHKRIQDYFESLP